MTGLGQTKVKLMSVGKILLSFHYIQGFSKEEGYSHITNGVNDKRQGSMKISDWNP